jgi:hypothetical protein
MGGAYNTYRREGNAYKFWLEYLKEGNHSGDIGVNDRIILEGILRK